MTSLRNTLFCLSVFTAFVSCSNSYKPEKLLNKCKTVIIFKNSVYNNSLTDVNGKEYYSFLPFEYVSYVNDNNMLQLYLPKPVVDTLVIETKNRRYIELTHKYNAVENVYFLFQAGDTVMFNYDSLGYPIAKSTKNPNLAGVYNFNKSIIHRVNRKFNVESLCILNSYYFRRIFYANQSNEWIPEELVNEYIPLDSLRIDYNMFLDSYKRKLDSLFACNTLNSDYYNYYSRILDYKKINLLLGELKGKKNVAFSDTWSHKYFSQLTDTLINFTSYHDMLRDFYYLELSRSNVKIFKTSNSRYADFRTVFDNLQAREDIPGKSKKILLNKCIEDIIEYFSGDDIKLYLNKYLALTKDTLYVNKIKEENNLDFTNTNQLKLKSLSGETTTLDKVLQKHKDKVIYIDFWASWCAPCRAAMPFAKELRKEYKNKDVVFIYLAKNDTEQSWKQAIENEGLTNNCENYIITNSKNSKVLQELQITTIPRYLLFDKNGTLAHKNAPGPEGKVIRQEIDKLLAKTI